MLMGQMVQAGGGAFYPYEIANSLRLDGAVNPLTRTLGSGGSTTVMGLSLWMKPDAIASTSGTLMTTINIGTNTDCRVYYDESTYPFKIRLQSYDTATYRGENRTTAVYRDPAAWYHVFIKHDRGEASSADRGQIWINGVRQDVTLMQTFQASGDIGWFRNAAATHALLNQFNGYAAEVALIDGTAYDATDFGEEINGVWVPKDISGLTFGTQGAYLDFQDGTSATTLGYDVSGNDNHYTPSGIATNDQTTDTPTNNFATFNPIDLVSAPLLSEGNTKLETTNSDQATCTMLPRTGVWYWEVMSPNLWNGVGNTGYRGTLGISKNPANTIDSTQEILIYMGDGYGAGLAGRVRKYSTEVKAGVTAQTDSNDIIGVLYDADNLTLEYFINNVSWYEVTGLNDEQHLAVVRGDGTPSTTEDTEWNMNFGNNGDFNGNKTAQGNADVNGYGDFYYSPPSDGLAVCSANLPEPTIGPNSAIKPSDCFATVLYTGNGTAIGSGGKAVTGVGFQPDMVWIKNRDAADQWMVFDSVRGATKYLSLDDTDIEVTDTESLSTFDADGFTLGSNVAVNTNTEDYVAYCFKITAGFFDIQSYTGNATARTIAHDLGVEPSMYMVKARPDPAGWYAYVSSLPVTDPETDAMTVHTNAAVFDVATYWNDTAPTSSVFSIGTSGTPNFNGSPYICYLFADVEGFCKTGYYEGNGSADGPFEYLGFSPIFNLTKRTSGVNSWPVVDILRQPINPVDQMLWIDLANAESAPSVFHYRDLLSNGIKCRNLATETNGASDDYITLSIGTSSKYSNAR